MSSTFFIYLYLKDEVQKMEEFEVKTRTSKDGNTWKEYYLAGIPVDRDRDGRFKIRIIDGPVPKIVKDIQEEISFVGWIPLEPKRILGIYEYKGVTATLEKQKDDIEVKIQGQNLEVIQKLYRKIRAGKIRPTESWEEKQISPVFSKAEKIKDFFTSLIGKKKQNA